MIPYVIDQKKRQEYFLFLILFTVISFALGYFFGYQNGQSDPEVSAIQSSAVESLIVEGGGHLQTISTDNETEKQNIKKDIKAKDDAIVKANAKKTAKKPVKNISKIKDNNKSSKKTTKDKPKTKPTSVSKVKRIAEKKTVNLKSDLKNEVSKKITTAKSNNQKPQPVKILTSVANTKVPADKTELQDSGLENAKNSVEQDTAPVAAGMQSAALSNKKTDKSYSIQVGMFASRPNAEKFVEKLKLSDFDVYLEDFISSSGQKKYNVRLGPYTGRALAKDKMALYKQSYTTPAYIVINK